MTKQTSHLSLVPKLALMTLAVPAAGAVAGELRGTVVDESGKPVRGAIVRAAMGGKAVSAFSGQDGSVVIPDMQPGSHEISVRAFGYGHERQFVDPSKQSTLKLVVTPQWDPKKLTTAEYISGLPENPETKLLRASCLGCHNWYPLYQTGGMKADGWMTMLSSMGNTVDLSLAQTPVRYRQYLSSVLEKYFGPDSPDPQQSQVTHVPLADDVLKAKVYEFDIPRYTKFTHSITADAKGNGWFTGYSYESNYIASVNFASGEFTFYPIDVHDSAPHTPILDTKGRVWTPLADGNGLNMVDPATGENKNFMLPLEQWGYPTDGRPFRLHTPTLDKARNKLWFSSMRSNLLVDFDLNTMEWVEKPPLVYIPDSVPPNTQRTWMAIPPDWRAPGEAPAASGGPDGSAAMADAAAGGRSAPPAPRANIAAASYHVEVDSKGKVWYTQLSIGTVASYDPKTGETQHFTEPGVISTRGAVIDRDDNVWYSNWDGGKLVKLDQKKGNKITQYQFPTKYAAAYGMVLDKKGNVWIADYAGDAVTRFNPKTEKFTEYPIPTNGAMPRFISVDNEGRVWFTEWWKSRVGVLVPDGSPRPTADEVPASMQRAATTPAVTHGAARTPTPTADMPGEMPSAAVKQDRGRDAHGATLDRIGQLRQ